MIEGRSLSPLLRGEATEWRDYAVSEYDYSTRDARQDVDVDQSDARLVMIFDGRWKYVHVEKMRPLLFDLEADPNELCDLATDPAHADQLQRLSAAHFEWSRKHHTRITRTAEAVEEMAANKEPPGIFIGYRDREELEGDGRDMPAHASG